MPTLRQSAVKFRRPGEPFGVRGLADFLGVGPAVSTRDLIRRLKPESIRRDSGSLGPSSVSGNAQLYLTSEGFWLFRGHVHESGALSHDYSFGAALDFADPSGKGFAFGNSGTVHGTLEPGSRDSDWHQSGYDRRIGRHWDELKHAGATFRLEVETGLDDVLAAVATILFTGLPQIVFEIAHHDPRVVCAVQEPVEATEQGPGEAHCGPTEGAAGPWTGF
jgi:hypothetical protein